MNSLKHTFLTLFTGLILLSCGTSLYDHYSYTQTLETKAAAISLINVSDQNFEDHKAAAEALKSQIDLMLTYERAKSKNEITVQMWQYLQNEECSLQQFLKLWQQQGTLSPVFKEEYRPQVEKIFDLMANYETQKDAQSKSLLLDLITL